MTYKEFIEEIINNLTTHKITQFRYSKIEVNGVNNTMLLELYNTSGMNNYNIGDTEQLLNLKLTKEFVSIIDTMNDVKINIVQNLSGNRSSITSRLNTISVTARYSIKNKVDVIYYDPNYIHQNIRDFHNSNIESLKIVTVPIRGARTIDSIRNTLTSFNYKRILAPVNIAINTDKKILVRAENSMNSQYTHGAVVINITRNKGKYNSVIKVLNENKKDDLINLLNFIENFIDTILNIDNDFSWTYSADTGSLLRRITKNIELYKFINKNYNLIFNELNNKIMIDKATINDTHVELTETKTKIEDLFNKLKIGNNVKLFSKVKDEDITNFMSVIK